MSSLKTIHVADLPALEARVRETCIGEECFVEGWEDRGGTVYVNGAPAKSGKGTVCKVRHSYMAACQRCKGMNIERPLKVAVRFEHGLDRLMFYTLGSESWEGLRVYCASCELKS